MAPRIIDGRAAGQSIKDQVAAAVQEFAATGQKVKLVAVQVGSDTASALYTRMQRRNCEQVGIEYELVQMPADTSKGSLCGEIVRLNKDGSVTAIILQLPLPDGIDPREIQKVILPSKDAEGVHPANMGKLFFDDYELAPCTALATQALLRSVVEDLAGKELVIVGHSEIFGKPLAAMLLASRAAAPTVTICHAATRDLKAHTVQAEVLIVATGAAHRRWARYLQARHAGRPSKRPDLRPLIGADYLQEGAVVIDVAVNRIPKILNESGEPVASPEDTMEMVSCGDVDFEAALGKVSAITPVPGGVGPVTVAMLLKNTVTCARLLAT